MINTTLISPADFISMPWRNGAGTTTELVKRDLPEEYDGSGFAWRLSMAEVVDDGYFSNFEYYDRTLVLLNGNGVTLHHNKDQSDVLSKPLEFAQFRGESITYATLHDGAIKDFNIITRRGFCKANTICGGGSGMTEFSSCAATFLIFAMQGDVIVELNSANQNTNSEIKIQDQSLLFVQSESNNNSGNIRISISTNESKFIAVEIIQGTSD